MTSKGRLTENRNYLKQLWIYVNSAFFLTRSCPADVEFGDGTDPPDPGPLRLPSDSP